MNVPFRSLPKVWSTTRNPGVMRGNSPASLTPRLTYVLWAPAFPLSNSVSNRLRLETIPVSEHRDCPGLPIATATAGEYQCRYFTSNTSERRSGTSSRFEPRRKTGAQHGLAAMRHDLHRQAPRTPKQMKLPTLYVLHNSTLRIFTKTAERTLPPLPGNVPPPVCSDEPEMSAILILPFHDVAMRVI